MVTQGRRRLGWLLLASAVLLVCAGLTGILVAGNSRNDTAGALCPAEQAPSASPSPQVPVRIPASVPKPTVRITADWVSSSGSPPPFLIRLGKTELELAPVTYCYSATPGIGQCVDGWDSDPPSIGSVEEFFVFVPVPGFTQLIVSRTADATAPGGSAARVDAESLGGNWWRVHPSAPPGTYRLDIFAQGDGGDMIADVRWQAA